LSGEWLALMAVKLAPHVPRTASNEGVIDAAKKAIGDALVETRDRVGEITLVVKREAIVEVCRALRDTPGLEYQQLMDIGGVDYPERAERFEVVYQLLSLTRNRRIRVTVSTDEQTPVPSITGLWPVAGWLEREVFDMYGVPFSGNSDLRRILTDYGFEGYPQRKDFPLTGHVELRYSEAEKRVVYEPVSLPQDFRTFDFLMPWEGAEYVLPGDEKARNEAPGAPSPLPASGALPAPPAKAGATTPKTTAKPADTGAGAPADKAAGKQARKPRAKKAGSEVSRPSSSPAKGLHQSSPLMGPKAGVQSKAKSGAKAHPGPRPSPGNGKGDA
jgi:NADH-quinone oxidoreductase subunit C